MLGWYSHIEEGHAEVKYIAVTKIVSVRDQKYSNFFFIQLEEHKQDYKKSWKMQSQSFENRIRPSNSGHSGWSLSAKYLKELYSGEEVRIR